MTNPVSPAPASSEAPRTEPTARKGAFSAALRLSMGVSTKLAVEPGPAKQTAKPKSPAKAGAPKPEPSREPKADSAPAPRAEPQPAHAETAPRGAEPAPRAAESAPENAPAPASAGPAPHCDAEAPSDKPVAPAAAEPTRPMDAADPAAAEPSSPAAEAQKSPDAPELPGPPAPVAQPAAIPAAQAAEAASPPGSVASGLSRPAPSRRQSAAAARAEQAGADAADPAAKSAAESAQGPSAGPAAPRPEARDPLGLIHPPAEPAQASESAPSASLEAPGQRHSGREEHAGRSAATPADRPAPNGAAPTMPVTQLASAAGQAAAPTKSAPAGPAAVTGLGDLGGLMAGRTSIFALSRSRPAAAVSGPREGAGSVQAQISQALAAVLRQKGGVTTLRLNPEHLGSMKIDLSIEAGKVTAVFDAQNEQTRQILRDGLDGLKRSIEQAGLTVHKIEVTNAGQPGSTQSEARDHSAARDQGDQPQNPPRPQHEGGSGGGQERPWSSSPEPEAAPAAEPTPATWVDPEDAARGLLRLRVDALV